MVTNLERFKRDMEPAKELYSRELSEFAKRYEALGEMTIIEEPDIDTQEYIFSFEKLNGTPKKDLDKIFLEISNHMDEFSRIHGIENFCQWAYLW